MPLPKDEVEELISSVPFWYHSIDFGETRSPGLGSLKAQARQFKRLRIPEVRGKSVLDIGAWDGFYAFECERRGARRVVALDHYVWSLDLGPFIKEGLASGTFNLGQHSRHWRPAELPGKRGYDAAHRILDSGVETVVDDFMVADLEALGSFDLVLYLGVLYHAENPLQALKRLASVTNELAIIETSAIVFPLQVARRYASFLRRTNLTRTAPIGGLPTFRRLRVCAERPVFEGFKS